VSEPRELRAILRENIARLLYDSECLGTGFAWEDIDPAIAHTWQLEARAAQRVSDPIVRAALPEIVAQALAQERGWDWPRLSNMGVAIDPATSPEQQEAQIELTRIDARKRLRHMGSIAVHAVLKHLREGGNDKHPHLDADVVRDAKAQREDDEARRVALKKPAFRSIDGGAK
jgi:hypothetical protein